MKQQFRTKKGAALTYIMVFTLGFLLATGIFIEYASKYVLNTPTGNLIKNIPALPEITRAEANMIAISENTENAVLGKVIVEITDGGGAVLIDINPFVEPDMQKSAAIAAEYAKKQTFRNLENKSIIYRLEVNKNTGLVGGPSAGTAMAVATMAAIENKQLRKDSLVTGAITIDGKIHPVGSIYKKTIGAGENNMNLFLIPQGQKNITIYEQKLVNSDILGFRIVRLKNIPVEIDIIDYAEKNYNLTVKEVSTIKEAYDELVLTAN